MNPKVKALAHMVELLEESTIHVEDGDNASAVLVKCVQFLLNNKVNPADVGAALAYESVRVLTTFAPTPESAYAVLLSALEQAAEARANEALDEAGRKMDELQNAPSTRSRH